MSDVDIESEQRNSANAVDHLSTALIDHSYVVTWVDHDYFGLGNSDNDLSFQWPNSIASKKAQYLDNNGNVEIVDTCNMPSHSSLQAEDVLNLKIIDGLPLSPTVVIAQPQKSQSQPCEQQNEQPLVKLISQRFSHSHDNTTMVSMLPHATVSRGHLSANKGLRIARTQQNSLTSDLLKEETCQAPLRVTPDMKTPDCSGDEFINCEPQAAKLEGRKIVKVISTKQVDHNGNLKVVHKLLSPQHSRSKHSMLTVKNNPKYKVTMPEPVEAVKQKTLSVVVKRPTAADNGFILTENAQQRKSSVSGNTQIGKSILKAKSPKQPPDKASKSVSFISRKTSDTAKKHIVQAKPENLRPGTHRTIKKATGTLALKSYEKDDVIEKPSPCLQLPPPKIVISDLDRVMSKRERNVRQMMEYVTNPDRDQQTVIREIQAVERTMQGAWDTNRHSKRIRRDPTQPRLTIDDTRRISELYPPVNYEPPSSENRDMRIIRGNLADSSTPVEVNTLRCISNYNLNVSAEGEYYERYGDYLSSDNVNYLPMPSMWTPRHTLMNTAPCISAPGIFQSAVKGQQQQREEGRSDDVTDSYDDREIYSSSTDEDEINAIY